MAADWKSQVAISAGHDQTIRCPLAWVSVFSPVASWRERHTMTLRDSLMATSGLTWIQRNQHNYVLQKTSRHSPNCLFLNKIWAPRHCCIPEFKVMTAQSRVSLQPIGYTMRYPRLGGSLLHISINLFIRVVVWKSWIFQLEQTHSQHKQLTSPSFKVVG